MWRQMLLVGVLVLLAACQPTSDTDNVSPTSSVNFSTEQITVSLETIAGWNAYTDTNHIVLAQRSQNNNSPVVTIWQPDVPVDDTMLAGLHQIADSVAANGDTATSEPASFTWAGHPAAYFTADNGSRDTFTLIIVADVDDTAVALNISNMSRDLRFLHETLPALLEDFTVNETLLGSADLLQLPDIIELPVRFSATAMEASQQP